MTPSGVPAPRGSSPTLSLVIPCYNEARNLPLLVRRIREAFAADGTAEIVLVDNGSTDDSPAVLAELLHGQELIRSIRVPKNQGYGYGILQGLAAARGDYLGWSHADMQTDPADALRALKLILEQPLPLCIYAKGARYGRPMNDSVFTAGMSLFETALLQTPLWDINAQPNVFPRHFYQAVQGRAPHDFSLDLYFYHAAKSFGLRIHRFPVRFGERAHGTSHWNIDWKSKLKFIKRTVNYSLQLRTQLTAKG
jgi:polyisoprenyl-phosphate glycosyltransferase